MLHCLTAARYAWSVAKTSQISGSISSFQTSALRGGEVRVGVRVRVRVRVYRVGVRVRVRVGVRIRGYGQGLKVMG